MKQTAETEYEFNETVPDLEIPFQVSTTECLNIEDVNLGASHETTQTNNQGEDF
jgi:hypothetical protein